MLEKHGPEDNPVTIRQLPDDDDYRPLLKYIENAQENHIVLDCSPDKVMRLFKQAVDLKMMEEYQVCWKKVLICEIKKFSEQGIVPEVEDFLSTPHYWAQLPKSN